MNLIIKSYCLGSLETSNMPVPSIFRRMSFIAGSPPFPMYALMLIVVDYVAAEVTIFLSFDGLEERFGSPVLS